MAPAESLPSGETGYERPTETSRWVLLVPLPLVGVFLAHAFIAPGDLSGLFGSVGISALWGGALVLGLIAVTLAMPAWTALRSSAARARRVAAAPETWLAVAIVAYLVMLTAISGRIAVLPVFETFERHWQGKVLDLIWLAILFGTLRRWAHTEAGLRWSIRSGSARPALFAIGGVFAVFAALTILSVAVDPATATAVSAEQLAYDATIPNLTEELIWRGAMLAVLDQAFGTSRTVLGALVGWGAVITAVAFGLGHTVLVDLSGTWSINIAAGVFATVMGLALGWIRARTGSIWPAFLLHCAPELGLDIGMLIAS